jgi:hypothetical protein
MPRRPPSWVPNQPLTTGRLAWLAAYPELQRRSSPWWAVPLRIATGRKRLGTRFANELGQEAKGDRMASYAFPVDSVARRLSQDEVAALRESGTLPDWFFDAVEEERKEDRRLGR